MVDYCNLQKYKSPPPQFLIETCLNLPQKVDDQVIKVLQTTNPYIASLIIVRHLAPHNFPNLTSLKTGGIVQRCSVLVYSLMRHTRDVKNYTYCCNVQHIFKMPINRRNLLAYSVRSSRQRSCNQKNSFLLDVT